jgi:putative membrane protein
VLVSLSVKARKRVAYFGALGLAAALVAVGVPALAADETGRTVVAQLGADGGVTAVTALGGADKPASNALPITLKVSATQNGNALAADKVGGAAGTIALRYVVSNTTGKQQNISYTDPAGKQQSLTAELQVPYVAQLDVILPQGWTGVHATGASITSMPDGSMDVRWSMVLFSPLGSPQQAVALTATGAGKNAPVATVTSRVVNPVSDNTLATTGVDANSTIAQNGLLGSYADGAKSGLDQLADGAAQLLTGLQQLADGANTLHAGLVQGQDGTNKLAQGLHSTTGQPDLLGGTKQLAAGVQAISDGLGQLKDTTGLPAIELGVQLLQGGVVLLQNGLGPLALDPAHPPQLDPDPKKATLQGGVTALSTGVSGLSAGVNALSDGAAAELAGLLTLKNGLACASKVIRDAAEGTTFAQHDPCYVDPVHNPGGVRLPLDPATGNTKTVLEGLAAAIDANNAAGVGQEGALDQTLIGGIDQILLGLSNPSCKLDDPVNTHCGLAQGLTLLQIGLIGTDGKGGLRDGLNQIIEGLSNPCDTKHPLGNPNANPPTGPCGLAQGLKAVDDGLNAAIVGANQLFDGSVQASGGASQIVDGLGQESAGLDQLAAGLPAATDGSKQIADGLGQTVTGAQQIATGQTQVRDQAVVPLVTQLSQGGGNAAGTLAVLTSLSTSAAKPPLGTGTTLILTQSDINPGPTWPVWLAIIIAAAAVIVGLIVGLLIGPRRRRHGA